MHFYTSVILAVVAASSLSALSLPIYTPKTVEKIARTRDLDAILRRFAEEHAQLFNARSPLDLNPHGGPVQPVGQTQSLSILLGVPVQPPAHVGSAPTLFGVPAQPPVDVNSLRQMFSRAGSQIRPPVHKPPPPPVPSKPVIAPKPGIASHPIVPPNPILAPKPVVGPKPLIAPKPPVVTKPPVAPKPPIAPKPAKAPKLPALPKPPVPPQPAVVPKPEVAPTAPTSDKPAVQPVKPNPAVNKLLPQVPNPAPPPSNSGPTADAQTAGSSTLETVNNGLDIAHTLVQIGTELHGAAELGRQTDATLKGFDLQQQQLLALQPAAAEVPSSSSVVPTATDTVSTSDVAVPTETVTITGSGVNSESKRRSTWYRSYLAARDAGLRTHFERAPREVLRPSTTSTTAAATLDPKATSTPADVSMNLPVGFTLPQLFGVPLNLPPPPPKHTDAPKVGIRPVNIPIPTNIPGAHTFQGGINLDIPGVLSLIRRTTPTGLPEASRHSHSWLD